MNTPTELLDAFGAQRRSGAAFWEPHLPDQADEQRALADAFDRLGVAAFNGGDLERARDAFFALFLLRLRLVKTAPDNRNAIRDFATAEDLLGRTLLDLGRPQAADEMLPEALRYRRGLHRDDPSDAHAAYLYGVALWRMACLARAKRQPVEERNFVDEARRHLIKVDETWPGISSVVAELAVVDERLEELEWVSAASGGREDAASSRLRFNFWPLSRSRSPQRSRRDR